MIETRGVYIELYGPDPDLLASFYERLFSLERSSGEGPARVLTGRGLTLCIRQAAPGIGGSPATTFGFEVPASSDLEMSRDEAVAAGAIVLAESRRGSIQSLTCQDPAGNEFVLVSRQSESANSLVPVPTQAPESTLNGEAGVRAPGRSFDDALPRVERPTRREWDSLRDSARIASMQEAIAGLDVPFAADDPATVLSEMRNKIGSAPVIDDRVAEADRAMRQQQREREADDMLARYRAQLLEEQPIEPAAPAPRPDVPRTPLPQRPLESAVDPSVEVPRTLGRSSRRDDDE